MRDSEKKAAKATSKDASPNELWAHKLGLLLVAAKKLKPLSGQCVAQLTKAARAAKEAFELEEEAKK